MKKILHKYLDEKHISFLEGIESKKDALLSLIGLLEKGNKLKCKDSFYQAIIDREKLISTGIGLGVAIPHAKLDGYEDFFIAIGISHKKGISWDSLDNLPVKLIFMIGGPEKMQTKYLQILSHLTSVIRQENIRKQLLKTRDVKQLIDLLKSDKV
jgi:nitrogen PTS system EIIA component